jgi:hypothetical protein
MNDILPGVVTVDGLTAILVTLPVADTARRSPVVNALLICTLRISVAGATSLVATLRATNFPFTLTASNTFVITLSFYDY